MTEMLSRQARHRPDPAYAGAVAMVAVSTLLGLWIAPRWGTAPVDMIYLPAVLAAAALWGLGPALLAGAGAGLAYNFFFTEPVHTFRMDRVADMVTVIVLLIVALVTSRLAAGIGEGPPRHSACRPQCDDRGVRAPAAVVEQRGGDRWHDLRRAPRHLRLQRMVVKGAPEPAVIASDPPGNRLTPSDVAAAALTLETGDPAGRRTPRAQPAESVLHPVHSDGGDGSPRSAWRATTACRPSMKSSCSFSTACSTRSRWRWSGRGSRRETRQFAAGA